MDQLERGDRIYIHVLDEILAYEVDQILPMVDKDDMATLQDALEIVEGEDHITLFTCTPYGVNSHRLLVRGIRVPYEGEEEAAGTPVDTMIKAVQNYYMLYLITYHPADSADEIPVPSQKERGVTGDLNRVYR